MADRLPPEESRIHTTQPPAQLTSEVRRIIAGTDPQQPISEVRTMDEIVAGETESRALQTCVLMTFKGVAILLARLGYLRSAVVHRVSPPAGVGLRMALGERKDDIFKMVLGRGAILAIAGLVPGARAGVFCGAVVGEPPGGSEAG